MGERARGLENGRASETWYFNGVDCAYVHENLIMWNVMEASILAHLLFSFERYTEWWAQFYDAKMQKQLQCDAKVIGCTPEQKGRPSTFWWLRKTQTDPANIIQLQTRTQSWLQSRIRVKLNIYMHCRCFVILCQTLQMEIVDKVHAQKVTTCCRTSRRTNALAC